MAQEKKTQLLQGSLDLLILQSLRPGPLHGYAISKHLREVSKDFLKVEEGSLYPALHRMEQKGWIKSWWGASEANRRAKFYELSKEGKQQLKQEIEAWRKMSTAIESVIQFES